MFSLEDRIDELQAENEKLGDDLNEATHLLAMVRSLAVIHSQTLRDRIEVFLGLKEASDV